METVSFRADAINQIMNSIHSADRFHEIYQKSGDLKGTVYWKAYSEGLEAALAILIHEKIVEEEQEQS